MSDLFLAPNRTLKLDDHRIIDPVSGEVVFRAKRRAPKNDRYYRVLADANPDYFQAPKMLGALGSSHLVTIAERNIDFASTIDGDDYESHILQSETYELAASALQEAAFVEARAVLGTSEVNDHVDSRIEMIDRANEALDQAIEALSSQPMTTLEQRLMIKRDFENIYKDIVCGEITMTTVKELRNTLNIHLYRTFNNTDSIHARGLGGEIRTFIDLWDSYEGEESPVALPATVRGDSGFFYRSDTHDIDRISKNEQGNWQVQTPVEVKRRRIAGWMLQRYTGSDLVQVRTGGAVQLVQSAKK
jgi:hypothetical protein